MLKSLKKYTISIQFQLPSVIHPHFIPIFLKFKTSSISLHFLLSIFITFSPLRAHVYIIGIFSPFFILPVSLFFLFLCYTTYFSRFIFRRFGAFFFIFLKIIPKKFC